MKFLLLTSLHDRGSRIVFVFCFIWLSWAGQFHQWGVFVSSTWNSQPGYQPPESPEERRGLGRELAKFDSSFSLAPHPCSYSHQHNNTRASQEQCLQRINFLFFFFAVEKQTFCLHHGGGLRFELLFMLSINSSTLHPPLPPTPTHALGKPVICNSLSFPNCVMWARLFLIGFTH